MKVFVIICASVLWIVLAINQEYCNINCGGRTHIGCRNKGGLSSACNPQSLLLTMTSELKSKFLKLHNDLRSKVASGKLKGFEPASHMGALEWDQELAGLAALNVKKCDMKHDQCRNTRHYTHAGQNVATWVGFPPITPQKAIEYAFKIWYEQHTDASMAVIDSNRNNGKNIGHFLIMVNERNNRIGCAILQTPKWGMTAYMTACNYPRTNLLGEQIYKRGIPGADCKSGKHSQYSFLCSTSEQYKV